MELQAITHAGDKGPAFVPNHTQRTCSSLKKTMIAILGTVSPKFTAVLLGGLRSDY
jgi:hypothetical protein